MEHIPVLDKLLRDTLTDKRLFTFSTSQMETLYHGMLLLSMNIYKAVDFNQATKFLTPAERKNLRQNVRNSSSILLGVRGFIYKLVQDKIIDTPDILEAYKDYEIDKNAYNTKTLMNLQLISLVRRLGIVHDYENRIAALPKSLTPKQAKKLTQEEVKKLNPYIGKYVYNKLRFIYSSNNMEPVDMANTLKYTVCHSCYDSLGSKRGLYLTNTLKTSINNAGINLIKYYSSTARARLVPSEEKGEGEGATGAPIYQNLIVSTSSGEEGEDITDHLKEAGTDKSTESDLRSTFYFAKKKMIDKYGKNSIHSRFIDILGNNSEHFVKWYNEQKKTKFSQVVEIQEEEEDNFNEVIKLYFGLSQPQFQQLLLNIKPHFIDKE